MERSPEPQKAAIVPKPGLFERIIGWCIERVMILIWRVLFRPILVAAFSPLLMVLGLAKVKLPERSQGRPVSNEATNPAGSVDGEEAANRSERDLEGRKDHG